MAEVPSESEKTSSKIKAKLSTLFLPKTTYTPPSTPKTSYTPLLNLNPTTDNLRDPAVTYADHARPGERRRAHETPERSSSEVTRESEQKNNELLEYGIKSRDFQAEFEAREERKQSEAMLKAQVEREQLRMSWKNASEEAVCSESEDSKSEVSVPTR